MSKQNHNTKIIVTNIKFLKTQDLCLRYIGLRIFGDETNFNKILKLCNWLLLVTIIVPEAHYIIINLSDIQLMTDALGPFLTMILTVVKISTIYFKKKYFVIFIQKLRNLWIKVSDQEKNTLIAAEKTDKICTIAMLFVTLGTGIFYLIVPIAIGIATNIWTMPMKSAFFIDINYTPVYEITYLWYVHDTFLTIFSAVGVDSIFVGSILNLCAHFQLIQKRFKTIKLSEISNGKIQMSKEFRDLVIYYDEVIQLTNDLNKLYIEVVVVTFLISSLLVCALCLQLILALGEIRIILYFIFLSAVLLQLFVYSYGGTQIMSESGAVLNAIYSSEWYLCSPKIRRSIYFCMMRASKCNEIRGGFYLASLTTFTSIISAAGSYVTLLQSFLSK